MKARIYLFALVMLIGVSSYSCKPKDSDIQKEVATALTVANSAVTSTVKEGVVTLSGVVSSEDEKAAAEAALKGLKNVKSVVNEITVKIPEPVITPDQAFQTLAVNAFKAGGFETVAIAVKDSIVTLTGDLKKADLKKVMQLANDLKPKQVVNQLTLK